MTKQDLSNIVARRTGIFADVCKSIIEEAFDQISVSLAEGENYYHRGFGTFAVVDRKAKTARNLSTGEKIYLPPCKAPKFIPSKMLTAAVKGGENEQ